MFSIQKETKNKQRSTPPAAKILLIPFRSPQIISGYVYFSVKQITLVSISVSTVLTYCAYFLVKCEAMNAGSCQGKVRFRYGTASKAWFWIIAQP